MQMATDCVFILLMLILACTSIHTHSIVGKMKLNNGFKEYAAKPKGTIKTMKWQGRDLVDCVDIYKQPSMNHPLLKNHTIQLDPSFPPNKLIKRNVSRSNFINVPENEKCPNGTIPIRRPFKDELTRAKFPPSRHGNRSKVNEPPGGVHKYGIVALRFNGAPIFRGVSAALNVWKPTTEQNTFSLAQLWAAFSTSPVHNQEVVEAGWMVYPFKFGDGEPRFFIFFTNDGYTTGCYNLDCPGFVHISRETCLGCDIRPQSTYEGDQTEVDLEITQNPHDKAWWILFNHISVGYYPHELFPLLTVSGANRVDWGGEVAQWPDQGPSPNQMGSGHFPEEGFRKAAYFRDLKYEEAGDRISAPADADVIKSASHPNCYRVSQVFREDEGQVGSTHFYYGGSGASAPGCKA